MARTSIPIRKPGKTNKPAQGVKKRTTSKKSKAKKRAKKVTNPFRFLDLHPEIRNSIYEVVLQSEETIIVDEKLELPPLLATCPQILGEAVSIWYRDNKFSAHVEDCNASALNEWSLHCCTVGQRDYFDVTISSSGPVRWENLVKWCKAIWKDDKARVLVWQDDMCNEERVICKGHEIAMEHKYRPWSVCLRTLEDMRNEEECSGCAYLFEDDELSDDDEG